MIVEIVRFEHGLYLVLQEVPQILILLFLLFINRMYTMSATHKASHKPFLHKYENLPTHHIRFIVMMMTMEYNDDDDFYLD